VETISAPPPLRQETWTEKISKKAAIEIPFFANRIVKWLLERVVDVFRFFLSLIPEAFGR
jgi:hypothetical protein